MTILLAVVVCLIHASQVRGYGTMDECKRRGEVCVRRGYHGVACAMLKSMPPQIRSSCIEEVHVGLCHDMQPTLTLLFCQLLPMSIASHLSLNVVLYSVFDFRVSSGYETDIWTGGQTDE